MNSNFRLALGGALLAAGAVLPLSAVFVFETDWPPILKSALTGILLLGPELAAIPAAAIMGRENFARIVAGLKRCIRSIKPAGNIGPVRHAIGIALFLLPALPAYVMAYLPSWMPDNSPARLWVNLLADAAFLASLFILGGDFWDKLRSLFIRRAARGLRPCRCQFESRIIDDYVKSPPRGREYAAVG